MLTDRKSIGLLQSVEKVCGEINSLDAELKSNIKNIRKVLEEGSQKEITDTDLQHYSLSIDVILSNLLSQSALSNQAIDNLSILRPTIANRQEAERNFVNYKIKDYIGDLSEKILGKYNLLQGNAVEIGASKKSVFLNKRIPSLKYQMMNLTRSRFDFSKETIVGDITNCPQIPDNSYDFIASISVFEHIDKPWLAANEIMRILRPGGITMHVVPFSYFYHEAPIDFWRYTPDGFASLFDKLELIHSELYFRNRRRDNQGSGLNQVDKYGGAQFSVDGFGGWRENWHTVYAGKKN